MSAPTSVPDTALGFTQSELLILRHQQQLIAQQPSQRGTMVDRGRGTSRHSQPSSRAASAASSQSVPGRIVLDPRSLSSLSTSLDSLLRNMRARFEELENATAQSVQGSNDRAYNSMQSADDEINRMKKIIREMDRLEEDCLKVKHIRDVVRRLKERVDAASTKLDKIPPSNHHARSGHALSARSDPRRR